MTRRHDPICLIGGGGHALVMRDAAIASGRVILGYYDDQPAPPIDTLAPRLGSIDDLLSGASRPPGPIILAVGDLPARRRILDAAPPTLDWTQLFHPSCIISPEATIDRGVFVGPLCIINARTTVAAHAIINSGAIVEHDCTIGTNAHIAPRSALAGGVTVGADTLFGIGAVAIPGVRIGSGVTIGAGAVVIDDIPDSATCVGIPARPLRTPQGH